MSSIPAGDLNRLLTFEERAVGVDELNQPIVGQWQPVFQLWGSIKTPSGMGSIRDRVDTNAYSIRVRYNTNINEAMRIVHLGMRFDIKTIKHDFDRREYTDLVCVLGAHND